jgi:Cu-processing system ATP-binding protein
MKMRIENVDKTFGKRPALRGVCASFSPGQVTGILGPNSCGKTTLMKTVLGLCIPDAGVIRIQDKPVSEIPDYRKLLGYMAQSTNFPENLTLPEIWRLLQDLRDTQACRLAELIDYFELGPSLHVPFGTLSGGCKQRAGAIVALMFDSPILIFDEPTASLDPLGARKMRDLIASEEKRGKTILLISHTIAEIDALAKKILMLMDASVVFEGSVEELRSTSQQGTLEDAIVRHYVTHTQQTLSPIDRVPRTFQALPSKTSGARL